MDFIRYHYILVACSSTLWFVDGFVFSNNEHVYNSHRTNDENVPYVIAHHLVIINTFTSFHSITAAAAAMAIASSTFSRLFATYPLPLALALSPCSLSPRPTRLSPLLCHSRWLSVYEWYCIQEYVLCLYIFESNHFAHSSRKTYQRGVKRANHVTNLVFTIFST